MATASKDGWLSAALEDGTAVHVRVGWAGSTATGDGHVVITDMLITGADITSSTLQGIHPARLLASVEVDETSVDLLCSILRPDLAQPYLRGDRPTAGALVSMLATNAWSDDDTTLADLRARAPRGKARPRRKRRRLGRPSGGNDFYARVAEAYRSATAESGRPAVVLAEENDVPVETVRRWVKEARRRGFLAAGRKGRAI